MKRTTAVGSLCARTPAINTLDVALVRSLCSVLSVGVLSVGVLSAGVLSAGVLLIAPAASARVPPPLIIGCADGTREGFVDSTTYPTIASCSGAWSVPGAFHDQPSCGREGGDDGANAAGAGCNVEDLCAGAWHVCYGPDDINIRTEGRGCVDAVDTSYPQNGSGPTAIAHPPGAAFFMTRTSGSGTGNCDEVVNGFPQSFNDIFGCGNMGAPPQSNCFPLNVFGHNQCVALNGTNLGGPSALDHGYLSSEWAWNCDDGGGGYNESQFVVKSRAADQGGVLCCKDSDGSLPEVCDGVDNDADNLADETDFFRDGSADDFPGDPCNQVNGQPGTIVCNGAGGWICGPIRAEACCYGDGACADRAPTYCVGEGGNNKGGGSTCAETACPVPNSALISGRIWHDVDGNGLEGTGEQYIQGVVVQLSVDADGILGPEASLSATTGIDGAYAFLALSAGTYTLIADAGADAVLVGGGFVATTPWVGVDASIYSEPSPLTMTLAIAQRAADLDFGFVGGCLGGTPVGTACDDRDPCTTRDQCDGARCTGRGVSCDDGNPCTDDLCGSVGCTNVPNNVACSDGFDCTGGDVCAAGACTSGTVSLCAPKCPNGQLDAGELCDDNNANNGDGCGSNCQLEYTYPCIGSPQFCVLCGNGIDDEGEQCDDNNHVSGDGCDVSCRSEDPCFGSIDSDGDGVCDDVDTCLDNDRDGYGIGVGCTGPDCNDRVASCTTDCITDRDGGDGNGVPDCEEPPCVDVDGDGFGVGDGCSGVDCDDAAPQCATDCGDTDRDRLLDCVDPDDDNDGVSDTLEVGAGSSSTTYDTDGDGVGDGDEILEYGSDPTSSDSDSDGMSDGDEVEAGRDPVDASDGGPGGTTDTDGKESSGCAGAPGAWLTCLLGLMVVASTRLTRRWRRQT